MKFVALFYAIHRVRRKETLLRSSRVPLEIFTSLSQEMTLRFLGVLFAFSLFLVKMSFRFVLLFLCTYTHTQIKLTRTLFVYIIVNNILKFRMAFKHNYLSRSPCKHMQFIKFV